MSNRSICAFGPRTSRHEFSIDCHRRFCLEYRLASSAPFKASNPFQQLPLTLSPAIVISSIRVDSLRPILPYPETRQDNISPSTHYLIAAKDDRFSLLRVHAPFSLTMGSEISHDGSPSSWVAMQTHRLCSRSFQIRIRRTLAQRKLAL